MLSGRPCFLRGAAGEVALSPEGSPIVETDLALQARAVGLRSFFLEGRDGRKVAIREV